LTTPNIAEVCSEHLAYMKWADEVALNAVARQMPDSLKTLEHIYLAEQVWLARVRGNPLARVDPADAPPDVSALQQLWPAIHTEWLDLAASTGDWSAEVHYRMNSGVEGDSPLWQIVLHLANHGSYHRGQISAMLRAAGFAPAATDLLLYYRANRNPGG
jgi:uncharacterized damage-inducible protein DinB